MIILDTDILIALLAGEPGLSHAVETLHSDGEALGTTALNVAEALRGEVGSPGGLALAHRKFRGLQEVPFGPRAARRFAQIMHALDRAGRPMPSVDGMIAAASLEVGGRIATRNVRHFERVPGLELVHL